MNTTYVRIRLGEEEYALPVAGVLEITEMGPVTPVPGAPPAILGVRNLRGQVMPIIDIAAVLGLGATPEPQRIAVVEDGEARAGLAVEEVLDVGLIGEVTGAGDSPFLSGSTLRDGTLVGVIDLSAVLSSLTATATEG